MGHYTEIHVVGNVPVGTLAENVIRFLFSAERPPEPEVLPAHRFFKLERWRSIGACSSYYLSPIALRGVELSPGNGRDLYFHSVSNLKNYDGEIEAFFEWLRSEKIAHYGHMRDENDEGGLPGDATSTFRRFHSYGYDA